MTERWQLPPERLILQFSGLQNALFYKFGSSGTRYFTSSVGLGVCFLGWADGVPGGGLSSKKCSHSAFLSSKKCGGWALLSSKKCNFVVL